MKKSHSTHRCPRYFRLAQNSQLSQKITELSQAEVTDITKKLYRRLEKLKYDTDSESDNDNEYSSESSFEEVQKAPLRKVAKKYSNVFKAFARNANKLSHIQEESFEHTKRNSSTSITYKGANNPLVNGKMDKIIGDLINEVTYEKQYKAKMKRLYISRNNNHNPLTKVNSKLSKNQKMQEMMQKFLAKSDKRSTQIRLHNFPKSPIRTLNMDISQEKLKLGNGLTEKNESM